MRASGGHHGGAGTLLLRVPPPPPPPLLRPPFSIATAAAVGCSCLELGCGSGYVSCSLALLLRSRNCAASVLVTDINPQAAAATLETLRAHQVWLRLPRMRIGAAGSACLPTGFDVE